MIPLSEFETPIPYTVQANVHGEKVNSDSEILHRIGHGKQRLTKLWVLTLVCDMLSCYCYCCCK